jgi:hypothetical protein
MLAPWNPAWRTQSHAASRICCRRDSGVGRFAV